MIPSASMATLKPVLAAVLFDVDFTLALPGPELGAEGYRRLGERHGLTLDPGRYEEARLAALASLQRHPELEHDDEIWVAFTERIVRGMGGDVERAYECAVELVAVWESHDKFTLYEDALPVLEELRGHGLKLGLVSNGEPRPGGVRPPPRPRRRLRGRLEGVRPHEAASGDLPARTRRCSSVEPGEAAMVGDSYEDDIEGARALGLRAFLLDRDGRFPDEPERLTDLTRCRRRSVSSSGRSRGRCRASRRTACRRARSA